MLINLGGSGSKQLMTNSFFRYVGIPVEDGKSEEVGKG